MEAPGLQKMLSGQASGALPFAPLLTRRPYRTAPREAILFDTLPYPDRPTADAEAKTKKRPAPSFEGAGQITGNDLLSRGLSPNYHRRGNVSLPGSEWDRVVPLRSGHQRPGVARVFTQHAASSYHYVSRSLTSM